MKKILIALIVWGAITFINIDLFASTTYQNITLDTQLSDLNNYTLRQVFEDYNKINNHSFDNNLNGWITYAGNQDIDISVVNGELQILSLNPNPNVFYVYQQITTIQYNYYYLRYDYHINDGLFYNWLFDYNNVYSNREFIHYGLTNADTEYSIKYQVLLSTSDGFFIGNTANDIYDILRLDNFYLIDLTSLGINLSSGVLDYYYDLYWALYNNIDLTVFYNQGSAVGYGNGLEDYHNGFYNYLDPTTGVPYNEGYNEGFIDGGVNGYNNGLNDYHYGIDYGTFNPTLGVPYQNGFDDGVISDVDTSWLLNFVSGTVNVLGVTIVPGISLGVFVFIPLFLGFIGFIFRLGGRRG